MPIWRRFALLLVALLPMQACSPQYSNERNPSRVLNVTVPQSGIGRTARVLQQFGEARGFSAVSREVRPDGQHFAIVLQNRDLEIIAVNTTNQFDVSFYPRGNTTQDSRVDQLIEELSASLRREVAGAEVIEMRFDEAGRLRRHDGSGR